MAPRICWRPKGLNSFEIALKKQDSKPSITVFFSKLPYDVEPEQALKHPEVTARIQAAMKSLTAATDKFLNSIVESASKLP